MEFSEVREYQVGDDIRTIDWNVTSRTGALHVKKFTEERELTVLLMLDASGSADFGTRSRFKRELAAEIGALLAFSAIRNNDRVGALVFTEDVEIIRAPAKAVTSCRVIRDLLYFEPRGRGTNLARACEYLNRITRKRAVVFVLSDFFDTGFEKPLRVAAKKHDLISIFISDPAEKEIPGVGLLESRTGERPGFSSTLPTGGDGRLSSLAPRTGTEDPPRGSRPWASTSSTSDRELHDRPLLRFFQMRSRRLRR
jgi:uncharacterized protein (DUF58 family)